MRPLLKRFTHRVTIELSYDFFNRSKNDTDSGVQLMSATLIFPFDSTGLSPRNLIENELRVVMPPEGIKDQSFIVPNAAAFFGNSLVIKDGTSTTARVLREHVDYELSHYAVAASLVTGKPCYGSITFIDRYYNGNVYLTYRTVGGDFSRFDHTWVEQQTKDRYALKHITFDQIVGVPSEFPTDIHSHKPEDMVGLKTVSDKLQAIADAITAERTVTIGTVWATIKDHLDSQNAHTKEQVGLSNLRNYAVAIYQDYVNRANNKYVTPQGLMAYLDDWISNILKGYVTRDELETILANFTPNHKFDGKTVPNGNTRAI